MVSFLGPWGLRLNGCKETGRSVMGEAVSWDCRTQARTGLVRPSPKGQHRCQTHYPEGRPLTVVPPVDPLERVVRNQA